MNTPQRNLGSLLLLAAIWGGAFLLTALAAPALGPAPLVTLRMAGAALVLLPLCLNGTGARALLTHWKPLLLLGLVGSAVPFYAIVHASLSIGPGQLAIVNATAPIFGTMFAIALGQQRLGVSRALGLLLALAGVAWLTADAPMLPQGATASPRTWLVALVAPLSYAAAAVYSRRRLSALPAPVVAGGSQAWGTLVLAGPALAELPSAPPSLQAWVCVALLAVLCTGVALALYYRLIARVGASTALSVTYLIPLAAVLWAWAVLGQVPTPSMAAAGTVVLAGCALANGWLEGRVLGLRPLRGSA